LHVTDEIVKAGSKALFVKVDVTKAEQVRAAVDATVEEFGRLDILVNNAGIGFVGTLTETPETEFDRVMSVNVKGAYVFSRACLRPMLRASAGRILNIGAFAVDRVSALPVAFAASKGALEAMTRALAREVGRYGVRVNCLVPGLCDVGMGARLAAPRREEYRKLTALGRLGTPEEIAAFAVWLCSAENAFMSGATVTVDGGL